MSIADTQQQSARSTRGTVPLSRFMLNGVTTDLSVTDATLLFMDGSHDEASITVTSSTMTTTDGLVDSTLSFYWGVSPHAESFGGYIVSVEDKSGGATGSLTFNMTVLGATKKMFTGAPQFWYGKTVPSAVGDIASRNGLGLYGHPHTYLWKALAQTDESDWAMANALTKRLGWRLWNRYGCLLCYDPTKLFTEQGSYCRLYMGTPEDYTTDRQLLEFTPVEATDTDKTRLGSKFGYFAPGGVVQVATEPGTFAGYKFITDNVIDSPGAATAYLDAETADLDTWKQSGMARIWGDADIYPGMCVDVVTTNRRYIKAKYDGKWLVRGASHQMDRQQYQTMLYLVRPSSSAAAGIASYTPFWRASDISASKPFISLNEGQWVSSKATSYRRP